MASITVSTLWVNVAADPSDYRAFPLMSALNVTTTQPGEVRQMASGRARLVLKAGGVKHTITASLPLLDRVDVEWLEERAGQLVCVRDDRGRKIWATFLGVGADENQGLATADVQLSLVEISHDETA